MQSKFSSKEMLRGVEQASCLPLLSSDISFSSDIDSDMEVDVNDTVDVVKHGAQMCPAAHSRNWRSRDAAPGDKEPKISVCFVRKLKRRIH